MQSLHCNMHTSHVNNNQECRKAFKSGGQQRLNRIDLYGENLIYSRGEVIKSGGHDPLASLPVIMPMAIMNTVGVDRFLHNLRIHKH